jgi:hypothetical protein
METRTCKNCSKSFTPSYPPQQYCSRSCSMLVRGTKKSSAGTFQTNCNWCSKETIKRLSQKGKTGNFCSVECGQAFKRGNQNQFVTKTCPTCQKSFETLYRKQNTYCSKSCSKSGSNHPLFGKSNPTKGKKTWIFGLTKETDVRVAMIGEKGL